MLRGLRTLSDMEYEFDMSLTNQNLDPEIETVFLMAVSRAFALQRDADPADRVVWRRPDMFLPPEVQAATRARLRERRERQNDLATNEACRHGTPFDTFIRGAAATCVERSPAGDPRRVGHRRVALRDSSPLSADAGGTVPAQTAGARHARPAWISRRETRFPKSPRRVGDGQYLPPDGGTGKRPAVLAVHGHCLGTHRPDGAVVLHRSGEARVRRAVR